MRYRSAAVPLLFLLTFSTRSTASPLSFDERVRAQLALERVAWSHREGTKAPFETAAPLSTVELKVRRSLSESVALERIWGDTLTAARLRRELDRMARASRLPGRLREIFDALGDDPVLLQEAIARPALVDRLIHAHYAWDPEIHASTRRAAEASAAATAGARVVERDDIFDVVVTDRDGAPRAISEFSKVPFDTWWAAAGARFDPLDARPVGDAALGAPSVAETQGPSSCTPDDTWDGGLSSGGVPSARQWHAAVWTGSELMVWGGLGYPPGPGFFYPNDGALYDPATDTWTAVAASPLTGRAKPTGVWTGSGVMIWGGAQLPPVSQADYIVFTDGAIYDPVANSWTSTSTTGTPAGRWDAPATLVGNAVVVYGGQIKHPTSGRNLIPALDGRRYNPATNTWSSMAASPLTLGPFFSGALVGGRIWYWGSAQGAGYDPVADNWVSMAAGGPTNRAFPVVLGTDHEILVWGGSNTVWLNDGMLYDPSTMTWRIVSTVNAPSIRRAARAVWTGKTVFLSGGTNASTFTWDGAVYDPSADTWTPAETRGSPGGRDEFSMTWSGREAILFGDIDVDFNDAKRYDPLTRRWSPLGYAAPVLHSNGGNAWTGYEWVHFGSRTAGRYDPALDVWSAAPSNPANPTQAVWTGSWVVFLGGRYDPLANTWSGMSSTGAPTARYDHTLVWTGSRVIAWGGTTSTGATNTGGLYDPVTDTWTTTSLTGAPSARSLHSAVWTGSRMIVWGGSSATSVALADGASYDPNLDAWSPIAAGPARWSHTAVWTGSKMVVWGGWDGSSLLATGSRYDPGGDSWSATNIVGAPAARYRHTAAWTGSRMIVWGGAVNGGSTNTGARYDPGNDQWAATSLIGAPAARSLHAAAWTGSLMLIGAAVRPMAAATRWDRRSTTTATGSASAPAIATTRTSTRGGCPAM